MQQKSKKEDKERVATPTMEYQINFFADNVENPYLCTKHPRGIFHVIWIRLHIFLEFGINIKTCICIIWRRSNFQFYEKISFIFNFSISNFFLWNFRMQFWDALMRYEWADWEL